SALTVLYFLQICATNLKFLSINIFLASSLPAFICSKYFLSSSEDNGSGNRLLLDIYPNKKTADFKNSKKVIAPKLPQNAVNINAPPISLYINYMSVKIKSAWPYKYCICTIFSLT